MDEYNRISYVELKRYRVAVFKDEDGVYHEYYRPLHPEKDNTMPRANVIPGTHLSPDLFADIVSDVYQLLSYISMDGESFRIIERTVDTL